MAPPHARRVLPWLTRCSCETATARIARNEVCVSIAGSVHSGASAISVVRAHSLSMGRDSQRATGASIIPTGMHVEIAVAKPSGESTITADGIFGAADSTRGLVSSAQWSGAEHIAIGGARSRESAMFEDMETDEVHAGDPACTC
jgi:hypothetical protein